jgi:hypothetical protein
MGRTVRSYDHSPDWDFIREDFAFEREGIAVVRSTIDRLRSRGDLPSLNEGVLTVLTAVAYGWALEEPIDELLSWLDEAVGWVDEALTIGPPRPEDVQRYLTVSALANAWDTARRAAATVPDGLDRTHSINEPLAEAYECALARLVEGDHATADHHAAHMAHLVDDPATPPFTVDHFGTLTDIVTAITTNDAPALGTALTTRYDDITRRHADTIEDRRYVYALLDPPGTTLAAIAHRNGLPLPDIPTFATTLIQEHR